MHRGPFSAQARCVAVVLFVALGVGCSGPDDSSSRTGSEHRDPRTNTTPDWGSGFGPCEDVTLEEFQQVFGDRFTAVKVGGTAADCTIVARDTAIGESITIRDSARAGYGEDFDSARTAATRDRLCPASLHDVDGIGDRAFYSETCNPEERPNESLHIELDGTHIAYSAFFVPADRIAGTEEALTTIAHRQVG